MKLKILIMLIILGLLSVTPMIYMGKFDPLTFLNSVFSSIGFNVSDVKPLNKLTNAITDEKVQVYKWRDGNGVMQFSNTPPPTETQAEKIVLDTNSNVMQAVKVSVKEEKPEQQPVPTVKAPSPYSIKSMKKVMDDARGVEELLQKRHEEQQKVLNNI
ncbi:MAG: DUF4124 domain-containing protein [Gammaproteobacteria bacterium]